MIGSHAFGASCAAVAGLLVAMTLGGVRADAGVIPVDTEFTYQGQLRDANGPINGTASVRFRLFNASAGGVQQGPTINYCDLTLVDGLFSVDLDFGTNVFDGSERWLDIGVQSPSGNCLTYTQLSPRQQLLPAPYSIRSLKPWETNATSIYYNEGNVGIGTTTPDTDLEISQDNAQLRLTSTEADGTSLLDLKGDAPLPGLGNVLGSIRFLDETNAVRAEMSSIIGLVGNQFIIELDGTVNLALGPAGHVGVGTLFPGTMLQVDGGTDSEPGSGGYFTIGATNAGNLSFDNNEIMARNDHDVSTLFLNYDGGDVSICAGGDGGLQVHTTSSASTYFNRVNPDGTLVGFRNDGTLAGSISVSGSTVIYGTFTGAHNGWTEETIDAGTLVSLTGHLRRSHEGPNCEPTYGIATTTIANDPKVGGTYVMPPDSAEPASHHLFAAVGNGEMWVVDSGVGDISAGDALISSDVAGAAMKDDPARFAVGHVVARAAEPVQWANVKASADGSRRVLLSVFYDRFDRQGDAVALQAKVDALSAENAELRNRLEMIESRLDSMATPHVGGAR